MAIPVAWSIETSSSADPFGGLGVVGITRAEADASIDHSLICNIMVSPVSLSRHSKLGWASSRQLKLSYGCSATACRQMFSKRLVNLLNT